MRIDELTIKNFKCFEDETFHFNPHFNVVIGKNGSGKSSLLDAVAVALNEYISVFNLFQEEPVNTGRNIFSNEVRTKLIDGQPKPQTPTTIAATGVFYSDRIKWQSSFPRTEPDDLSNMGSDRFPASTVQSKLNESRRSSNVTFPLVVSYGTLRLQNAKYYEERKKLDYFKQGEGVFLAYELCLFGDASREVFLSWFKTYEDELRKFHQPIDEIFLNVFKAAISSMVPEWTDMAFSFRDDDMMGILKAENGEVNKLPFKNLSDGYRNVIGMVADMVYRCIQLNPGLKENVLTETDGIVLIDELDLHLHPEWQRRVAADLKRIFPKVQFIVTTHSPFIIQSLTQDELIVLDKDFVEDKDPWRKSIEEIAQGEMQVNDVLRSGRFNEMIVSAKEYFTLIKQNDGADTLRAKIDAAKHKLDKLRTLYSDDPAYVAMLETQLEKAENHEASSKE